MLVVIALPSALLIRRKQSQNGIAYYTTPTAAFQIIAGTLPLPLKAETEAVCIRISRLNTPSNLSDSNFSPDHFERKIPTADFHPALFNIEDRINLCDHHISEDTANFFTDGSKTQDKSGSAYCLWGNNTATEQWRNSIVIIQFSKQS
ncbi:hypothetical protein AVEN_146164-1 [Araneus ventricosus]|uniref:Uncharacterized protein n=1 Tax=Araneus ventricosus TaxID=182803 RepID=A0A4Y2EJ76_ARAVE|nr:hypothetical protein AVEN_146164-1 [Araneus ventricosus]